MRRSGGITGPGFLAHKKPKRGRFSRKRRNLKGKNGSGVCKRSKKSRKSHNRSNADRS